MYGARLHALEPLERIYIYIYIYVIFNNEGTSLFEKKTANLLTIAVKSDPWLWQKVTVICYRSVTIDILVHSEVWYRSRLIGSNFFIGQTVKLTRDLGDLRFVLISNKYFLLIHVYICYDKIESESRIQGTRGKNGTRETRAYVCSKY